MKRLFLFTIFLFIASCGTKPVKKEEVTTTPPSRTDVKHTVDVSTKPVTPKYVLTDKISESELVKRTVFSMYQNDIESFVGGWFEVGIHNQSSPLISPIRHMLTSGMTSAKRFVTRVARKVLNNTRPYYLRDIVDNIKINGGILNAVITSNGMLTKRPNYFVFFKPNDMNKLKDRFSNGEFGVVKSYKWGGLLTQKSRSKKLFFYFKKDSVVLSDNIDLLKPAMAISLKLLKSRKKINIAFSFTNVKILSRLIIRELRHLFPLPQIAKTSIINFINGITWISVDTLREKSNDYVLNGYFKFAQSSKSPLIKAALQSKDVTPLAKYIHKDSALFYLDGTNKDYLKKLLNMGMDRFKKLSMKVNKKKKKQIKYLFAQAESFKHLFLSLDVNSAFGLRFVKKGFETRSVIDLIKGTDEKKLFKSIKSLLKNVTPQKLYKIMPKRDKKEFKPILKFLRIKIRNKKIRKTKAILATYRLNWKKIPAKLFDLRKDQVKILEKLIGKKIEVAFIIKDGKLFGTMSFSNAMKELKDLLKGKGALPGSSKFISSFKYSLYSGVNMEKVATKVLAVALKFNQLVNNYPNFEKSLRVAKKYIGTELKNSWSFYSMGIDNKSLNKFYLRIKNKNRLWPSIFGYLAYSAYKSGVIR